MNEGKVTLARDGVQYEGKWTITRGLITVSSAGLGSKTTQVGGSADVPEGLARIMLGELITEYQSHKRP